MGTRQDINNIYRKYYNKDFPSSTLSKWTREGKIKASYLLQGNNKLYDYDLDSFEEYIQTEDYKNKIQASKHHPKDYIGKRVRNLLVTGIVPKEDYKHPYKGTLMYCTCLLCGKKNVQVRFSYLTPNGNYFQDNCGCTGVFNRKSKHFIKTTNVKVEEKFLEKYKDNFEDFLFVHKLLANSGFKKGQTESSINEYYEAVDKILNDKQFKAVYWFWSQHKEEKDTFYDWAKPSIDHIIPKSKGGDNNISNFQVLTVFENLAKRDKTQEEWNDFKKRSHTNSDYFIENIIEEYEKRGDESYE